VIESVVAGFLAGVGLGFAIGVLYMRWWLQVPPFAKRKPPKIPLDAFCPACGNSGCELNYDAEAKRVARKCRTCGCIVTQPVIAPDLFKNI
jgi:hypothetical protein